MNTTVPPQDELLRRQEVIARLLAFRQTSQQELERKAAELKRREEDLERRAAAGGLGPQPNWPPLPSWIPWKPCFYHDINVEIAPEFQTVVGLGYKLWIGTLLM